MDPFTQKLLARTQARKNQLIKKREELEACRAKRNSPVQDRSRRPLSEDNTESGSAEIDTDEIKRRRIGSDDSAKSTVKQNSNDIDVNSPSVQARKERLMKMQQKDQENGVTPKKHWKALNQGSGMTSSNTSSPSVASRSAAFENNAKDEQKENTKDKKSDLKMPHTPGKLAEARSVFENGTSEESNTDNKKEKFFPPPKPPRLASTETSAEEKPAEQQQTAKRKAPSPPKAKKENDSGKAVEINGTSKRKAPEPPISNKDGIKACPDDSSKTTVKVAVVECEQKNASGKGGQSRSLSVDEEGDGSCTPVPAKRERKGSVDSLEGVNKTESDQPTPKPRRKVQNETVTIVATPVDEGSSKQKPQEQTHIIQACVVEEKVPVVAAKNESSKSTVTVQAVSCNSSEVKVKAKRKETTKVTSVEKTKKHSTKTNVTEKVSDNVIPAVAMEMKPPSSSSSRKTKESTKKDDFAFKVPRRPTAREVQFDPNETVNLNDVNIHEITFSFDFDQFDQELEKDRKNTFTMSYEEKCKQLEKEHKREEKKKKDSASASTPVEKEERGTYQSGYNNTSSEQYATKTVHHPKPAVPQRPRRTQDMIKILLEEAAYQQNIVLQASQALNLCASNDITFRGSQEEIEAERVLLLATEHRTACLDEVQKLKSGSDEGLHGENTTPACMATLSLSDVKINLRQDFMDVLRVGIRQDLGVFYFVCIIQHGPHEFYCTKPLSTNDATEGNFLLFPDKFTLKDIKPDFNVAIKVFCMNVKKAVVSTPVNTPNKHKIFQSPKVVKGILRRGSDNPSPAPQVAASPQSVFRTSSFSLAGVTHVNLPIIKSKRFCLDKVPDGCPLSNCVEIKAECSPQYSTRVNGFLTILEDIGGYGAWQRRWCVLQGAVMSYWRYPGDESIKSPMGCINLAECISKEVTRVARDLCARPNTMELKLKRSCGTDVKYLLAADTKADRSTWIDSLNDALRDGRAWSVDPKKPLYPDLSRLHNQDVYMCSKADV